jgi:hypothetical protein
MSKVQALWILAAGEAFSLPLSAGPRELSVARGRVWLTVPGSAVMPAEDQWLETGQTARLAADSLAVVEGWPEAQFLLLELPAACPQRSGRMADLIRPLSPTPATHSPCGLSSD